MSTPLSNDDAFNNGATAHAGLSLLVIYTDVIVVITGFSPQVAIFAEGCAAMLYTERQY